jgi:hypothetical protein
MSARRLGGALVLPGVTVAAVGAGAFLWRTLTWPVAASPDAWAYAAWGQALARAERPLFELGATAPKPLAAALGFLVVPLPPERGFAVLVALALGALAAVLFLAAHQEGGSLAGALAVAVLLVAAPLDAALAFAFVDAVTALLVLVAVVARGRLRIGALVLAGLLRQEAWLLAGLAGLTETRGSWPRRAGVALLAGAAAPLLWMLADVVLAGDPLGTAHWLSDWRESRNAAGRPWSNIPEVLWGLVDTVGAFAFALCGLAGLVLHYLRGRRGGGLGDPLALAVALLWTLAIVIETRLGTRLSFRYLLPVFAVLSLGCGLLAAALVPARLHVRNPWPGAVAASLALVLAAATMGLGATEIERARNERVAAARPAIESALSCGRLGVTRLTVLRGAVPQLAAATRTSIYEFGAYRSGEDFAAVLHFANPLRQERPGLPDWPRRATPIGPLAVAPGCAAFER